MSKRQRKRVDITKKKTRSTPDETLENQGIASSSEPEETQVLSDPEGVRAVPEGLQAFLDAFFPLDGESASPGSEEGFLEFMGFDYDIPRQELAETVEAWREYIKHKSKEAEKDQRAAELVTRTRLRCGIASCMLRDWPTAIADLEQVRDAKDVSSVLCQAVQWLLDAVYAVQGEFEPSIANWSKMLTAYENGDKEVALPKDVTQLYLFRAQLYAEQDEFEKAVADCDRAELHHPELAEIFSVRGLCYANLGNMERALADCDHSIELPSCTAQCYRRRGLVRNKLCDYHHALEDFDRALELDPEDEWAKRGRSRALYGSVLFRPWTALEEVLEAGSVGAGEPVPEEATTEPSASAQSTD